MINTGFRKQNTSHWVGYDAPRVAGFQEYRIEFPSQTNYTQYASMIFDSGPLFLNRYFMTRGLYSADVCMSFTGKPNSLPITPPEPWVQNSRSHRYHGGIL